MPSLLFDENISHRLVARLAAAFPGSEHVRNLGLRGHADADIWEHAAARGFVIVTKDDDFRQMSFLRGAPPKVIWLVLGNATTSAIAQLLERRRPEIERFHSDTDEALLVLRPRRAGSR